MSTIELTLTIIFVAVLCGFGVWVWTLNEWRNYWKKRNGLAERRQSDLRLQLDTVTEVKDRVKDELREAKNELAHLKGESQTLEQARENAEALFGLTPTTQHVFCQETC